MAGKSFYLAAGVVAAVSSPFRAGSTGASRLPDGPCLVAASHTSFLDGPLLALAYAREKLRPLHMVAYAEPFDHWLFGWFLRSGRCIPFRRGNQRSQCEMLKLALGWLKAGEAVGIFPEGHISRRPALGRPRRGAALIALESGLPIVPAAVIGSNAVLPPGASFPNLFSTVSVAFGAPIELLGKERNYAASTRGGRAAMIGDLSVRIMHAIATLSGRPFAWRTASEHQ